MNKSGTLPPKASSLPPATAPLVFTVTSSPFLAIFLTIAVNDDDGDWAVHWATLAYSRNNTTMSPTYGSMPRARLRTISTTSSNTRMASPSRGPPSPTMSEATNASQLHFGVNGPEKIITRADLRNSSQAYENVSSQPNLGHFISTNNLFRTNSQLLNTCTAYREALIHMSRATASFADAMGTCARCVSAFWSVMC